MLQGIAMGFVLGVIFAIQALRVKSWLSEKRKGVGKSESR